ncbi:inorganic pyrophosphatase [Trichoderma gracile]
MLLPRRAPQLRWQSLRGAALSLPNRSGAVWITRQLSAASTAASASAAPGGTDSSAASGAAVAAAASSFAGGVAPGRCSDVGLRRSAGGITTGADSTAAAPIRPPIAPPYSAATGTGTAAAALARMGLGAPPPPSGQNSSASSQAANSLQPSRRTAQIAAHLSSSPSPREDTSDASSSSSAPPTATMANYTVRKVAPQNTLEHRVYIEKDGVPISPFHDIPLFANQEQTILNMVVEIPRWTNAKLEISKEELLNPIKQDVKKGKLRYVRNCFPHKGYLWNYGAFPQTWEDPNTVHPETKAKGDNDPLDVCEIGELVGYPGQVKQVKVLGVMALLDEEETDWKVIVIDVNDPLAPKLNDVEDVERHLPGLLRATNEWFRIYKIPDGKPENQFAFTGECKNKSYAMDVIRECAEAWERLITGKTQPGSVST